MMMMMMILMKMMRTMMIMCNPLPVHGFIPQNVRLSLQAVA
jgi:hypothetical protein